MIYHGDCRTVMAEMEPESIDAIVTDPPYGLTFMGKGWDHGVPGVPFWVEALRVLKPGGHLLAFGGTRTHHRLMVAIEDAGFEIRDCLMWLYGSGFPKSLDVSKAIDKASGAEREITGQAKRTGKDAGTYGVFAGDNLLTAPATDAAKQWDGWGTALKPAWEPIILARKPLIGTVAANVQAHGTGALNIDGCRIEHGGTVTSGGKFTAKHQADSNVYGEYDVVPNGRAEVHPSGRWPANVALDSDAAAMLDAQSGERPGCKSPSAARSASKYRMGKDTAQGPIHADTGGASRFFYTAKASRKERGEGNTHPTVKPIALMRWLVRMVTPPGGVVLDPFMGSGTTLLAAEREGFTAIGIELTPEYIDIARRRLAADAPLLQEIPA